MIEAAVAASTAYLSSQKARDSIAADPYWPKWDSPWWHMVLLWELGLPGAIPHAAAEAMLEAMNAKYLRFMPNPREPLPPGKDGARDASCHCALGIMYQVLYACGLDMDGRAPWMRAWFLHYQLPDGGLNCDEKAYSGEGGSSSIQSTLPVMEAVLRCTPRRLTLAEEDFLDRGANYLLARRLAYRRRDGKPMSAGFLQLGFPRFYDYDHLRGFSFVAEWAKRRGAQLPDAAVMETVLSLRRRYPDGALKTEKSCLPDRTTWSQGKDGAWTGKNPTFTFALLDACRAAGLPSKALSREWARARSHYEGS